MKGVTEDHLEQATLESLAALGWETGHGPDGSPPDARTPGTERDRYRDVVLPHRLRAAIARLNPHIPAGIQDEPLRRVCDPNIPGLVAANRQMHRWLVEGVPVQYQLGLNSDEMAFYDALATNEAAVRELGDETLKKIAVELTQKLRASVTVDWSVRETVRARLRVMVKTLLKRYKYPPDRQEEATETVLKQAESLLAEWGGM